MKISGLSNALSQKQEKSVKMKTSKRDKRWIIIILICVLTMFVEIIYLANSRTKVINEFNKYLLDENNSNKMCQLYDKDKIIYKITPRGIYYPTEDIMCAYIGDSPPFYMYTNVVMHEYCHHLIRYENKTEFCGEENKVEWWNNIN